MGFRNGEQLPLILVCSATRSTIHEHSPFDFSVVVVLVSLHTVWSFGCYSLLTSTELKSLKILSSDLKLNLFFQFEPFIRFAPIGNIDVCSGRRHF
jgi:hypothetical protein